MTAISLIDRLGRRVNVERRTDTVDASGSVVTTWSVHLLGIAAFIQPASGAEALRYGRESNRKFHRVYVAPELDIRPSDRLTGGDMGTRILDIQAVRLAGELPTGNAIAHKVLECEETD